MKTRRKCLVALKIREILFFALVIGNVGETAEPSPSQTVVFQGAPTISGSSNPVADVVATMESISIDFIATGSHYQRSQGHTDISVKYGPVGGPYLPAPYPRTVQGSEPGRKGVMIMNSPSTPVLPGTTYEIVLVESKHDGTESEPANRKSVQVTTLPEPRVTATRRINVSNTSELLAAVGNIRRGDDIVLAPGTYTLTGYGLGTIADKENIAIRCDSGVAVLSGLFNPGSVRWSRDSTYPDVWYTDDLSLELMVDMFAIYIDDQHVPRLKGLEWITSNSGTQHLDSGWYCDLSTGRIYVSVEWGFDGTNKIDYSNARQSMDLRNVKKCWLENLKWEGFAQHIQGASKGLIVRDSEDFWIKNCEVTKCEIGIQLNRKLDRILLDGILFTDGIKAHGFHTMKENAATYFSNESMSSLITTSTSTQNIQAATVRNCRWSGVVNGACFASMLFPDRRQSAWFFHDNIHERVIEAFEIEDANINVGLTRNVTVSSQGMSLAPNRFGPTWFVNNVVVWGWRAEGDKHGFMGVSGRTDKEAFHNSFGNDPYEPVDSLVIAHNTIVASTGTRRAEGLSGQSATATGQYVGFETWQQSMKHRQSEFSNNIVEIVASSPLGPAEGFVFSHQQPHDFANEIHHLRNQYHVLGAGRNGVHWVQGNVMNLAAYRDFITENGHDPDNWEKDGVESDPKLDSRLLPTAPIGATTLRGFGGYQNVGADVPFRL